MEDKKPVKKKYALTEKTKTMPKRKIRIGGNTVVKGNNYLNGKISLIGDFELVDGILSVRYQ